MTTVSTNCYNSCMQKQIWIFVAALVFLAGAVLFGIIDNMKSDTSPQPLTTQPAVSTPSPTGKLKTYSQFPGVMAPADLANKKAVLQTSKGKIEFEIYPEASKTASNFIFLAKDSFYDGLKFHRVVPGFVIQGGDPEGTGRGGPGYQFEDESVTRSYSKGVVAMANAGPNTNGSQFFITLENQPTLPPQYTIFGKVISGQDVVSKIQVGDVIQKAVIEDLN